MTSQRRRRSSSSKKCNSFSVDQNARVLRLHRARTSRAIRDLGVASRRGDLQDAFSLAASVSNVVSPDSGGRLHKIASAFFLNELGGNSALYYASVGGYRTMVETYLCLMVILEVEQRHDVSWYGMKHTMADWFDKLLLLQHCSQASFRQCSRCATNVSTREVFSRSQYTVDDMLRIVNQNALLPPRVATSIELENVRRNINLTSSKSFSKVAEDGKSRKTKAARPVLQVEDEYDLAYRPDEDLSESEISNEIEEESTSPPTMPTDADDSEDTISENETLSMDSNLTLATLDGLTESVPGDVRTVDYGTYDIDADRDEWVDEFSLASSFAMLESPWVVDDSSSNWELVPDERLAVPVGNKSYCDAARCGRGVSRHPATIQLSICRTTRPLQCMKKILEEEEEEEEEEKESLDFDSDFIMKGVKESRGGKQSLQFKGKQKTTQPKRRLKKR